MSLLLNTAQNSAFSTGDTGPLYPSLSPKRSSYFNSKVYCMVMSRWEYVPFQGQSIPKNSEGEGSWPCLVSLRTSSISHVTLPPWGVVQGTKSIGEKKTKQKPFSWKSDQWKRDFSSITGFYFTEDKTEAKKISSSLSESCSQLIAESVLYFSSSGSYFGVLQRKGNWQANT